MDRENGNDMMRVNLSNVFSPHTSSHMAERVYEVDFSEYGNPMVETEIVEKNDDFSNREKLKETELLDDKDEFQ